MTDPSRTDDDLVRTPDPDETRDIEHDRVRFSNDRDQARERAGETPPHAQGYDEAVGGSRKENTEARNEETDPDSAESDVDRDDTGDE